HTNARCSLQASGLARRKGWGVCRVCPEAGRLSRCPEPSLRDGRDGRSWGASGPTGRKSFSASVHVRRAGDEDRSRITSLQLLQSNARNRHAVRLARRAPEPVLVEPFGVTEQGARTPPRL